jgi:hypothetical protein
MGDAAHQRIGAADLRPGEAFGDDGQDDAGDDGVGRPVGAARPVPMEIHQRLGMLKTRGRNRLARRENQACGKQMVVQVASDAAEREAAIDAGCFQFLWVTDARAHQQERRADGAGREHDDVCMQKLFAAVAPNACRRDPASLDRERLDKPAGDHREVRAREMWGQVGVGGADATAVADRELVGRHAGKRPAIVLGKTRCADRDAGLDIVHDERMDLR